MASIVHKTVGGQTYYYLREMARVGGKPKMISQRYLGKASDIEAAMDGAMAVPERSRHLALGDLAAVWSILERLGVAAIIDEVVGARRSDPAASVGTYIALAAANRVVKPCSKLGFAEWWATTAGDRWVRVPAAAMDHRRFWDAMHAIDADALVEIERRLVDKMVAEFGLDRSGLVLDMTNFASYIDSAHDRADIAQRGHAKQKRTDLRLVGLGLVVSTDGGIPICSHAYAGNKHDVTQFTDIVTEVVQRWGALAESSDELTLVYDAGQDSEANQAHIEATSLHFIGSLPPSDFPGLLAVSARRYRPVDPDTLSGESPATFDLQWRVDPKAITALAAERFGKRILFSDHDDWPVAQVVAGYRSQFEVEGDFRQMKDPTSCPSARCSTGPTTTSGSTPSTACSPSPWPGSCGRQAANAAMAMSVRELLDTLAGLQETVLLYPSTGGRPKARRMLTETDPTQQRLYDLFGLDHYAPAQ
jgi:Transposase DDE domain